MRLSNEKRRNGFFYTLRQLYPGTAAFGAAPKRNLSFGKWYKFNLPLCGMGKVKVAAAVFELPRRLGILQYVEHELERCTECLYVGLLVV